MKLNINTSINFEHLCKAITHSVWSVLNDNIRAGLDHIREWLITPQKILPSLYLDIAFIPGNGLAKVIIEVWRRNEHCSDKAVMDYPLVIRYYYGFHVFQLYIPANDSIKGVPTINLGIFNYGLLKDIESSVSIVGNTGRKSKIPPYEFKFNYDSFNPNKDGTFSLKNFSLIKQIQEPLLFIN